MKEEEKKSGDNTPKQLETKDKSVDEKMDPIKNAADHLLKAIKDSSDDNSSKDPKNDNKVKEEK